MNFRARVGQELGALRTLIKRHGPADAIVQVFAGDRELIEGTELAQKCDLRLNGLALVLILSRDAAIERNNVVYECHRFLLLFQGV